MKIELSVEQVRFLLDHLDRLLIDLMTPLPVKGKKNLNSEVVHAINQRIKAHRDIYLAVAGKEWGDD